MRIVFFGTPHFAKTILAYLLEQKSAEVVAVVTRPDKPKGRSKKLIPSPVKEFAQAHHLPLYQPQKASSPEFASFLQTLQADFFVVAAYAEILKENILEIPKHDCLNVHASILPKYRGAAPIQRSIMAGEIETGVTIMKMALKMDAGDIFAISKTDITPDMTAGELTEILAELGKIALWDVMEGILTDTIQATPQNHGEATFAKKLTSQDGEVCWSTSCQEVFNHIRGVTPNPGAWCWVEVKGEPKRLGIKKAQPEPSISLPVGALDTTLSSQLIIGCKQGSVRLLEVQLEGKKSMRVEDFLRGISLDHLKFASSVKTN